MCNYLYMPTIAICSSADFYEQVNEIADQLTELGYTPIVPHTAKVMKESGDYEVSHYKTWFDNADNYNKKAELMTKHFKEIEKSDSILVVNEAKHGIPNYIGPNVLMEMAIAFYLGKPIYILNELPENSAFEEELKGFMPTVLGGQLEAIQ